MPLGGERHCGETSTLPEHPRCRATSKRTGQRRQAPALRGWTVCRMHGARGGHSPGARHPASKHGARTQECVQIRKAINEMVREVNRLKGRGEEGGTSAKRQHGNRAGQLTGSGS